MPSLQPQEVFEDEYTARFRNLVRARGLLIHFQRDRAALDLGLMLTRSGSLELSGAKVWFQLKGIHASTLDVDEIASADTVAVTVRLEHLRFWYAAPEATYLCVYLEAVDRFVAEDVRDIVDRRWGASFLLAEAFPVDQTDVTVHVATRARLTDELLDHMVAHRSMRIDGPSFRGRPLGHRLDPLRCELDMLPAEEFESLVTDLLSAYEFVPEATHDPGELLAHGPNGEPPVASLVTGSLHTTWEWLFQLGTEFGFGHGSTLREEGQVFRAFGHVAVLIHSKVLGTPLPATDAPRLQQQLRKSGTDQLLIFSNARDDKVIGPYRAIAGDLYTVPQGLGSLAYNVLTSTLVYLDHRERLRWRQINYRPS